jgi:hypothetical protein
MRDFHRNDRGLRAGRDSLTVERPLVLENCVKYENLGTVG